MSDQMDNEAEKLVLLDLPNEILIRILYNFTTLPLLNLRIVSHRVQNLILKIVHSRLLLAASLEDRKLILECYHPSAQYSEPYLYCDYLGTPGLSGTSPGQGAVFDRADGSGTYSLKALYSRFRPTRKDPQFEKRAPHPAGDIPGTRTSDAVELFEKSDAENEAVKRTISLDTHENFSQLVFNTDLVQLGPRRGVFLDIMSVDKKKTLRIFRKWLSQSARDLKKRSSTNPGPSSGSFSSLISSDAESQVIWTDESKKMTGLKLLVEELRWRRDMPVLLHKDEDQAVKYSIELQELYISTIHLLLAIEDNILHKEQGCGNAMIFTSFRTSS